MTIYFIVFGVMIVGFTFMGAMLHFAQWKKKKAAAVAVPDSRKNICFQENSQRHVPARDRRVPTENKSLS